MVAIYTIRDGLPTAGGGALSGAGRTWFDRESTVSVRILSMTKVERLAQIRAPCSGSMPIRR